MLPTLVPETTWDGFGAPVKALAMDAARGQIIIVVHIGPLLLYTLEGQELARHASASVKPASLGRTPLCRHLGNAFSLQPSLVFSRSYPLRRSWSQMTNSPMTPALLMHGCWPCRTEVPGLFFTDLDYSPNTNILALTAQPQEVGSGHQAMFFTYKVERGSLKLLGRARCPHENAQLANLRFLMDTQVFIVGESFSGITLLAGLYSTKRPFSASLQQQRRMQELLLLAHSPTLTCTQSESTSQLACIHVLHATSRPALTYVLRVQPRSVQT